MATVASGAASDRLLARATRDRDSLLAFLSRDRLYAAYAIADMDDREFARTRWGMALKDGAVGGGVHGVQRHLAAAALRHG